MIDKISVAGTFNHAQSLNRSIYYEANARVYQTLEILAKIVFYSARLREKGVHKERSKEVIHCSVMAFSWLMAFANRMGTGNIQNHMCRHFLACPYCAGLPCSCKVGVKPTRRLFELDLFVSKLNITGLQNHLASIYTCNTLERSADHLIAESAELMEAWMTYHRQKDETSSTHLVEEFCDAVAHILAVAHCAGFDLSQELIKTFANGCPSCGKSKCECNYVETANSRVILK